MGLCNILSEQVNRPIIHRLYYTSTLRRSIPTALMPTFLFMLFITLRSFTLLIIVSFLSASVNQ